MSNEEREVVSQMKKVAAERPETKHPTTAFIRDWAYGNAGLEDEKITRQQVEKVIPEKK